MAELLSLIFPHLGTKSAYSVQTHDRNILFFPGPTFMLHDPFLSGMKFPALLSMVNYGEEGRT